MWVIKIKNAAFCYIIVHYIYIKFFESYFVMSIKSIRLLNIFSYVYSFACFEISQNSVQQANTPGTPNFHEMVKNEKNQINVSFIRETLYELEHNLFWLQ